MKKAKTLYSMYRYELIAALIGASIMILELVGARLIAPFFGTSIYVWTAVIGVILGAIALGEMIGGRWADRSPQDTRLAEIISASALLLFLTQLIQEETLVLIESFSFDIRLEALIASILLFAPLNFFLGVVSPYLAKLKLTSLKKAGQSVGTLYGAGTIGSIVGTFLAGYFLLSYVGSRPLGLTMVAVLIAISFIASPVTYRYRRVAIGLFAVFFATAANYAYGTVKYDTDSAYARYQVIDVTQPSGQTVRQLRTDGFGVQSAIHLQSPGTLIANYNKLFYEALLAADKKDYSLLIGGGVFTFPRAYIAAVPSGTIDVIEIDPKLEEIAKDYFFYQSPPRINVINEDGRVYLNSNRKVYDLVFMDAYTSLSPPFQLTTQEAVARVASSLSDDGGVYINLISAIEGPKSDFLKATMATYRTHFATVEVYKISGQPDDDQQNLVVYAAKDAKRPSGIVTRPRLEVDYRFGQVLTDNLAPVERMTQR